MTDQQPTVGRIVHYVSHGTPEREDGTQAYAAACRAAIITEVPKSLTAEPLDGCPNGTRGEWIASLAVLNPSGTFFQEGVPYDEGDETPGLGTDCPRSEAHGHPFRYCSCGWIEGAPRGGTWHWPERV